MFKRKLFKRALPIILSVAMVFQSMPATALAAEDPAVVETSVEDTDTADSGTTDSDAADSADETTADEEQEPAGEEQQPDADTPADGEGQPETGTPTDNEGQSETGTTTDGETQPGAETPVYTPDLRPNQEGEQPETEATSEELQEAGDGKAAIESTVIKVENLFLASQFEKQNDKSEPTYNVSYSEGGNFDGIGDAVKGAAKIYINGEDRTEALRNDYLSYEWRTAGSESAMQGLPKETGSYVLRLKVTAVEGVCGDAVYDIYFNIEKAQLTLELKNDINKNVATGSKVSDFKAAVLENYVLKSADNSEYDSQKALHEIKAEDIVLYKAGSDGVFAVNDDAYFNSEEKYKFTVKVTLADSVASNYEVDSNNETDKKYYGIEFAGLTETKVQVALKNPGTEIIKTYDEQNALTAAGIAEEYVTSYEVVTKADDKALDEQESAKKLVSPQWYTKEKGISNIAFPELDDETQFEVKAVDEYGNVVGTDRYTLMSENPKDAGEYYLVYVYSGENGKYKKGYSDPVKVTIEPVSLVLKPSKVVMVEGMDRNAVAKALAEAEYELWNGEASYIKSSDIVGENATRADFFGVSYSDKGKTQYYSPVFKLETRQKKPAASIKDGATEEEKWGAWTEYTGAALTKGTEERPVEYRVKFSGQKTVYNDEGDAAGLVDVTDTTTNSAEKNYCVKADEDTLKNNTLLVELGTAAATEIKVDRIVKSFIDAGRGDGTIASPAWKIYDEDYLFADRASYKLADVTGEIKDAHEDITYTWQTGDMSLYEAYIHTDAEANEGADKKRAEENLVKSFGAGSTRIPMDAGVYRLHIEYKDSSIPLKNQPASKDVYFLIKQQELLVVADPQYASYGDDAAVYRGHGYSIYMLDNNSDKGEELDWNADSLMEWNALSLGKNPDGTNKEDVRANYIHASEFINDTANPYVYKAEAFFDDATGYVHDRDGYTLLDKNGYRLKWSNYTNKNKSAWDAEKKRYDYHTEWSDFVFSAGELAFSINMPADRVYNGMPVAADLPENFITLTDKATGAPVTDVPLNIGAEEVAGAVNVRWLWSTDDGSRYVSSTEARYGGAYTLYVSFAGNENYKAIESQAIYDKDGNPFTFTIKPLDVIVTPILNEVTAGQTADELVDIYGIDVKAANEANPIPESDLGLFENISGERRNAFTGAWEDFDGYAILQGFSGDSEKYCYFESDIFRDNTYIDDPWSSFIRYGKKYTVRFSESNILFAQYAASYNIEYRPKTADKISRGEAGVWDASYLTYADSGEDEGWVNLYTERDDQGVYTILPREGIPFAYKNYYNQLTDADGNKIPMDKNYVAVGILSPIEFSEELSSNSAYGKQQFLYRKSIKDAGGYVLEETSDYYEISEELWADRYYIKALFPVEPDEEGKKIADPVKEFKITWEEGYTETFKLDVTNAKLESNLREAVAPKSLAFNGVQAKMAVGETQQLDVKITKVQLGDVIQINYRLYKDGDVNVTHNEYASIDPETGRLTALATNNKKATPVAFEAYPVRLSADGKTFEEITDKGVKVAKGKVTVSEVTAPAIKKVIMGDTTAEVQFTHVNDGYRKEIYVVDASVDANRKKWKQADFEKEIAKMTNEQWEGIFAIAPVYVQSYYDNEDGDYFKYDKKSKLDLKSILDLDAKGSYVVYVRNVSAARTLADGSKVALSAAGTTKAFETTKVQVNRLYPWFNVEDAKNPVKYYADADGYVFDDILNDRLYTVSLFDKTAQVSLSGRFPQKPYNEAAENADGLLVDLPLKAAEKALNIKLSDTYLDPKVTYYITDGYVEDGDVYAPEPNIVNKKQTNPSAYATIAKNGKVTLKGVGRNGASWVKIWAVADNEVMGDCSLLITASPDTIIPKKVKPMKVGDGIRLADYLEYKNGKNKIPNYWSSLIVISEEEIQKAYEAGYELHRVNYSDYNEDKGSYTYPSVDGALRYGEWIITATKANSQKITVKFTDYKIDAEGLGSVESSIELSSAQMDPVKGLKVAYVDDKFITLNFAYAGHPDAFDIEVTDARGSVVYKKLAWRQDALNNTVPNDADRPWIQEEQRSIVGDWPFGHSEWQNFKYFAKTKTYAYTIHTDKLMRLSAYTISVKPVYNGESAAKAATAKTKTTNIPASYWNLNKKEPAYYTGIAIDGIYDRDGNYAYFTSGNTYTLEAELDGNYDNDLARIRGTDTLTWKSSNTKVASIKANPGSYTATLKAVQQGTTTITVTSKITKKVIARYLIAVKAVGKGAPGYGGDYESGGNNFYDEIIAKYDPLYEGRLEVLTLSNPVTVNENYLVDGRNNDRTWVQFTAPTYGEYTFSCSSRYQVYTDRNGIGGSFYRNRTFKLEANQKIYFRVSGVFTLRVSGYTDFTRLTTANTKDTPLKVNKKNDSWISFTAPEDNYYTFNSNLSISTYSLNNVDNYVNRTEFSLGLKEGQTVFIKAAKSSSLWVSCRDMSKNTQLEVNDTGVTVKFTKDARKQYVKFTASATGDYTFETPEDDVTVRYLSLTDTTEYYNGSAVMSKAGEADTTTPNIRKETLFIESGETIVIELTLKDEKAVFTAEKPEIEAVIKVTSSAAKELTVGADAQPVTKETTATFSFKVPEESGTNKYVINVTDGSVDEWYNSKHEYITYGYTELTVNGDKTTSLPGVQAGDTVYIKVTATDTAKDASVSVTKVDGTKTLTVGDPLALTLKNGFEDWYTFTVKKTGYYQFSTTVAENPAHTLYVASRADVFSSETDRNYISLTNKDSSSLMKLDAGTRIAFKVWTDDAAADATTGATFTVTEIGATALGEGETPVSFNNEGSALCYSFTGKVNEAYTISWTAGENSGAADVRYGTELTSCNRSLPLTVMGTDTYYITVTQSSATAVSGTLTVTKNKEAEPLVSGKTESFSLKGGSVSYKFTIPEDSELGYAVIVENTTALKEGETTRPAISVDVLDNSGSTSDVYYYEAPSWTKAYEGGTKNITISGGSADAEVTGNITVKPITAEVLDGNKDDVKVTKAAPVWYRYEVTSADRYVLEGAANTDKTASVRWYKKNGANKTVVSSQSFPVYLEKDDVIYAKVSTTEVAEQSAALKLPAVVTTTALTLGEDGITGTAEVTLAENQTEAYYTFTAPAFAAYTFEGYGNIKKYVPSKKSNSDDWYSGNTLEKDEVVLIKVTAAGTLKVTKGEITELKLDTPSKEITLQANESARFVLNTYVRGMYDFRTTDVKGLSVSGYYNIIDSENRLYFTCATEESNERITFSITNDGEAEAKFTVTAGHVVPVELTLDKPESVTVQKGRTSILRFKAPETGRYTVSCEGSDVTLNNEYEDDLYRVYDSEDGNAYTYTLNYNGTADSGTATVTVTALKANDVSGEEFTASLGKDEAKWYAYRVSKTGEYAFTTEAAGVTLQAYYSLASESPYTGSAIIAEGTVIYIRAENAGEAQDAVIKAAVTAIDGLNLGTQDVTFEEVGMKYMTFKAGADGFYTFRAPCAAIEYYGNDVSKKGCVCGLDGQYFIMKDEIVFLRISTYSAKTITATVIKGEELDVEPLSMGNSVHVESESGESKWITFTAPKAGEYVFYSTDLDQKGDGGDPYAYLYAGGYTYSQNNRYYDAFNDDGHELLPAGEHNYNFAIKFSLRANQTIYLEAAENGSDNAVSYNVNVRRA